MTGPLSIGTADEAVGRLASIAADELLHLVRMAILVSRQDVTARSYSVRRVDELRIAPGVRRLTEACTRVALLAAVDLAADAYLNGAGSWQEVIDVLSVAAPWCEILQPAETVGQAMARVLDFSDEVDALLADVRRSGESS